MAAIVSIAVGAIGTMVGTAIGAAIGGTILGISAATIGGVIGAGIAGGLLSSYRGGDFGKGFLMGAAGGAIGAFAKAGIGAMSGGTEAAAGAAAEGAAAGAEGAATTGALEGIGTTGGMEGISAAGTEGGFSMDALTGGAADTAGGGMSTVPTEAGGFSLDQLTSGSADLYGTGMTSIDQGTAPTGGLNEVASTQGGAPAGNLTAPDVGGFNADPTQSTYGLTDSDRLVGADYGTNSAPAEGLGAAPEASTGGGMLERSDNWLGENLGMDKGSTAKLAKGGLEYLYKDYQADKLSREVNKLKPLTFDQYAAQFTAPGAYKQAAASMAKGGRTGALPALLARMKNEARSKYAGYLQPQQEKYLAGQAGLANVRTSNLGSLFNTVGSTGIGF